MHNNLTAKDIKREILGDLLLTKHYVVAVTESINNSDVFGVSKSLYSVEYEVKVDKYDLLNEIKDIKATIKGVWNEGHSRNKIYKHDRYLGKNKFNLNAMLNWFVPNRFYFAVPNSLMDIALDGVNGTPYGVVTIGEYFTGYMGRVAMWGLCVRKEALKMHKDKVQTDEIIRLARKSCTEAYFLRDKYEIKEKYDGNISRSTD